MAERMRREARAMAAVSHPNLAYILAAETWRSTPFLVFEYLPGGTLSDRLDGGALHLRTALRLGQTLADALQRLHGAGILHRDIKPSNVGFTPEGTPKLLDFGLARLLKLSERGARRPAPTPDPERERRVAALVGEALGSGAPSRRPERSETWHTMTDARTLVGTPLYLAPEALEGGLPEPAFDLWGLNMLLYESISGTHPLAARASYAGLLVALARGIPDIRELAPRVPEEVAVYLRCALSVDPGERPSTPAAVSDRLNELQAAMQPT